MLASDVSPLVQMARSLKIYDFSWVSPVMVIVVSTVTKEPDSILSKELYVIR